LTAEVKLVPTSDFPSTTNDVVIAHIRNVGVRPRVAWVPPFTSIGRERFPAAQAVFQSLGVPTLDYCDIDQEPNESQLDRLHKYDVIYLTGGDPLGFRTNIVNSRLSARLSECLAMGRLVVAASGGAMQFTNNVSLFRLLTKTVVDVVAERDEYEALGIVNYELLPHVNKLDAPFLDKVQHYSERVPNDIVGLEDGAALIHQEDGLYRCVGRAIRFRDGVRTEVETAVTGAGSRRGWCRRGTAVRLSHGPTTAVTLHNALQHASDAQAGSPVWCRAHYRDPCLMVYANYGSRNGSTVFSRRAVRLVRKSSTA
jgi:peptidase E